MNMQFLMLGAILAVMLPSPGFAAEQSQSRYALGVGLEISSGTFGTGSVSTYVTAPLIADWFPTERLDVELVVPLVYQRTMNTGHAVLGTAVSDTTAKSVMKSSAASGVMMNGAGGGGGGMLGGEYGLGDITLTGGYTLLMDSETMPHLRSTIYVKFPTADESRGFGTGKFDAGAGVALAKWYGNWQPFAEVRYIVQGAAGDDTGAKNFVTADTGIAYGWNERLTLSTYARYGTALFEGMSAPLEARLKSVWRFGERIFTEAYIQKGFSDGSPDFGGGVSLFKEF